MTPETQTRSFLSGKLHHVDIAGIEKELFQLWSAAARSDDSEEQGITRACALNFVTFSSEEENVQQAETIIDEITVKHPCRAILAIADPAEKETLDAWVTARCHLAGKKQDKQICCEQITVKWTGEGTRQLVSVVAPLTIPDLPTCIWWQDNLPSLDPLRPFLPHVDRIIVDSMLFDSGVNAVAQLENLLNAVTGGTAVYDLNWRRLLPWRQAIAHAFDGASGKVDLEDLDVISAIDISVAGDTDATGGDSTISPVHTQGLLLLGWLCSRLGWRLESARKQDGLRVSYRLNRTAIKASINHVETSKRWPGTGHMADVRIRFRGKNGRVLRIWHDESCPGLKCEIVSDSGLSDPASGSLPGDTSCFSGQSQSQLIDEILDHPERDRVLPESVASACDVIRFLR